MLAPVPAPPVLPAEPLPGCGCTCGTAPSGRWCVPEDMDKGDGPCGMTPAVKDVELRRCSAAWASPAAELRDGTPRGIACPWAFAGPWLGCPSSQAAGMTLYEWDLAAEPVRALLAE